MPLYAFHRQLAGERSPASVLDRVAELRDGGWFADDAVVHLLVACAQGFGNGNGAVCRVAFFIGGQEEGNRAGMRRPCRDEGFDRGNESGQRAFHVGGAAPVKHAFALYGLERVAVPLIEWSGGDDVGVSCKTQQRASVAAARPQVGYAAAIDVFAIETDAFKAFDDDWQASAVFRGDRAAGNQLFGKLQSGKRRAVTWHLSVLRCR
jgi:hypothetical protein